MTNNKAVPTEVLKKMRETAQSDISTWTRYLEEHKAGVSVATGRIRTERTWLADIELELAARGELEL